MSTMRIPIFDAIEDAYWWVLCTEKYFKLWSTPETLKMTVAALAMKGPALTWWLQWHPRHPWMNWDAFTSVFLWQFKPEWRVILPLPDDEEDVEFEPEQSTISVVEQSTMVEEGISDFNQHSSSLEVVDLEIADSIEDSLVQSQFSAKTPFNNEQTPLFFEPENENQDGENKIQPHELLTEGLDTVPAVTDEQKDRITLVCKDKDMQFEFDFNLPVPNPVRSSSFRFTKFGPALPPKPPDWSLSVVTRQDLLHDEILDAPLALATTILSPAKTVMTVVSIMLTPHFNSVFYPGGTHLVTTLPLPEQLYWTHDTVAIIPPPPEPPDYNNIMINGSACQVFAEMPKIILGCSNSLILQYTETSILDGKILLSCEFVSKCWAVVVMQAVYEIFNLRRLNYGCGFVSCVLMLKKREINFCSTSIVLSQYCLTHHYLWTAHQFNWFSEVNCEIFLKWLHSQGGNISNYTISTFSRMRPLILIGKKKISNHEELQLIAINDYVHMAFPTCSNKFTLKHANDRNVPTIKFVKVYNLEDKIIFRGVDNDMLHVVLVQCLLTNIIFNEKTMDDIRVVQLVDGLRMILSHNGVNNLIVWVRIRKMGPTTLGLDIMSCSHTSANVALHKKLYPNWSHTALKVGVLSIAVSMGIFKEIQKLLIAKVTQEFAFLFRDGTLSYVKELASYFINPTIIFNVIMAALVIKVDLMEQCGLIDIFRDYKQEGKLSVIAYLAHVVAWIKNDEQSKEGDHNYSHMIAFGLTSLVPSYYLLFNYFSGAKLTDKGQLVTRSYSQGFVRFWDLVMSLAIVLKQRWIAGELLLSLSRGTQIRSIVLRADYFSANYHNCVNIKQQLLSLQQQLISPGFVEIGNKQQWDPGILLDTTTVETCHFKHWDSGKHICMNYHLDLRMCTTI